MVFIPSNSFLAEITKPSAHHANLARRAMENPCVKSAMAVSGRHCTTAQEVAGKHILVAVASLHAEISCGLAPNAGSRSGERTERGDEWESSFREWLFHRVIRSMPVLWESDCVEAALSMEIPNHEVSISDERGSWWTFGNAGFKMTLLNGTSAYVNSMCQWTYGGCVYFLDCAMRQGTNKATLIFEGYPLGGDYPVDYEFGPTGKLGQRIVMDSFFRSPYIPKEDVVAYPGRRRGKRRVSASTVRFVAMRKSETRGISEGRVFSSRWLVRGHLRNQWYPSMSSHKLIWVPPYVKGPDGAPMRAATHTETVGHVVR